MLFLHCCRLHSLDEPRVTGDSQIGLGKIFDGVLSDCAWTSILDTCFSNPRSDMGILQHAWCLAQQSITSWAGKKAPQAETRMGMRAILGTDGNEGCFFHVSGTYGAHCGDTINSIP